MEKEEKKLLKNIATYNWSNPNSFNAITSVVAFLVAIIGFLLLGLIISPLLILLNKLNVGIGISICISALLSQSYIFLVASLFCKIKNVSLFGGRSKIRFNIAICLPALALSVGTFLFIMPVHMQFAEFLGQVQEKLFGVSSLDEITVDLKLWDVPSLLLYAFIIAPILPAICEEALFRGVVMEGLREFGSLFAILISGLLFALMHGNYAQIILQFVLGCEIAFVVIMTDNYFAGIVMHFVNNFFAVVYSLVIESFSTISVTFGSFLQAFAILFGIILLCIAVVYYYKLWKYKQEAYFEGKSFIFYKPLKSKYPSCLLQKGASLEYCFAVEEERVRLENNEKFLFFFGKRFHKFSRRSNKKSFWIVLGISLFIAVGLIFLDFILVG